MPVPVLDPNRATELALQIVLAQEKVNEIIEVVNAMNEPPELTEATRRIWPVTAEAPAAESPETVEGFVLPRALIAQVALYLQMIRDGTSCDDEELSSHALAIFELFEVEVEKLGLVGL